MGKQKVEDKDQELIQKFRSVVHLKEQQKREGRKRMATTIGIACCAVLVSFLGYLALNATVPETIRTSEKVKITAADAEKSAEKPSQTAESEKASSHRTPPQSAESIAAGTPEPEKSLTSKDADTPPPAEPMPTVQAETRRPGTAPEAETAAPSPAPAVIQSPEGIRIARVVACRRVADRQPVAPQTVFSLEKDNRPDVWVWMDVRSDRQKLPYTLKHVYYIDGRKYAAVPLTIRYPRMRTWSNITLKSSELVGRWQVAVVTDRGETVGRLDFTVTP